jgi:hypothetical protein
VEAVAEPQQKNSKAAAAGGGGGGAILPADALKADLARACLLFARMHSERVVGSAAAGALVHNTMTL